jgi:uncharacterized sulfatase
LHSFKPFLGHCLLLCFLALCSPALAAAAKPNVLFILIDDMGYGDLTCYDPQAAPTPRIDQLAKEGIRFTQFYVSTPICSPSRCSFVTGQWPQRWKITSYLFDRRLNDRRGNAQWLDPAAPSLARSLRDAGYATGHFGKWHLGGGLDVGDAPLITDYGYDETLTNFVGMGDRVLPLEDKFDGSEPKRDPLGVASEKLGRGKVTWVDRSIITTRFAERAVAFMDKAVADGKPFYVNLWPDDVHSPFFPPKALRTSQAKRDLYRAVVRATDAQLTPILDHVNNTPALRDDTIIILASDNGPEPGAGTAGPFRGHKGNLYEGGIREPLIVWCPSLISPDRAGATDDTSVLSGLDFAPSIRALAGLPAASTDGQDASAALLGQRPLDHRAAPLTWRRPPDRPGPKQDPFPDLAMRDGNWKFLCMADGSAPQLYDLSADPAESHNLADEHPDRVTQMKADLLNWNASMPKDHPDPPRNPPGAASKAQG